MSSIGIGSIEELPGMD